MKDTQQSTCTAIMSDLSQALEACVSPTSTPAENPWFKRPSNHPFKGFPPRDKMAPADWDHSAKHAGVIRIGDAPCGSQGATEPEGVTTPNVNTIGNPSDLTEKNLVFGLKPEHAVIRPVQANLARCSDLPKKDSGREIPPLSTKHMPRKLWRSGVLGTGDLSGSMTILSQPLHTPFNREQSSPNTEGNVNSIQNCLLFSQNHLLPSASTGLTTRPCKAEGDNTVQNQRKSSNLSEIERQRGPIKKRHINYQPDVLDLSTKRTKAKTESRGGLVNSSMEGYSSCGNIQPSQSERVNSAQKLFQEKLSLSLKQQQALSGNLNEDSSSCGNVQPSQSEMVIYALKQEQAHEEVGKTGIPVTGTGPHVLPMNDVTDWKYNLDGVTTFDQKQGLAEPSAQFRSSQLSNQTLGINNVSSCYPTGNLLVPVLPSTELVRQWVLHVTQSNKMFATQQLTPDSESSHSSTSDASHQGSMSSSPTFQNPGRSPLFINASLKMAKPYACDHCSSTFKHRHHVIRHMRAHNGERPFNCEHCGATFARKCVLTNHRRTHTGEKPYICAECGDTFSRKHHLVIHQRTHSGEKPYRCLDCGAAFARSHHANRHRKTHGKEQEVDDHIEYLKSASSETNNQPPSMVPLNSLGILLNPEIQKTPSLEHVVSPPVDNNTSVELISHSTTVQNTQIVKDPSDIQNSEIKNIGDIQL